MAWSIETGSWRRDLRQSARQRPPKQLPLTARKEASKLRLRRRRILLPRRAREVRVLKKRQLRQSVSGAKRKRLKRVVSLRSRPTSTVRANSRGWVASSTISILMISLRGASTTSGCCPSSTDRLTLHLMMSSAPICRRGQPLSLAVSYLTLIRLTSVRSPSKTSRSRRSSSRTSASRRSPFAWSR